MLESALARPRFKWASGGVRDLATLAAAYGFGLIRKHPYCDGNKRIGLLAIVTFLGINGHDFEADEADVVREMLGAAAGHVSEEALAEWIREPTTKPPRSRSRDGLSGTEPESIQAFRKP